MSQFETWQDVSRYLDKIAERCEALESYGFEVFVEMADEGPILHIYGGG